jgi:hypothetical protein
LNNSMPVKKETSPESNKTSASNFASAFKSKVGQIACFVGSMCCGITTCHFIRGSQSMWVWNCPLVTVIICILSLLHVDKMWEMIHRILWTWEIVVVRSTSFCTLSNVHCIKVTILFAWSVAKTLAWKEVLRNVRTGSWLVRIIVQQVAG